MKPLRVAIFTPSFLPKNSGAEIFHHNLALRLCEAGHTVTVCLPHGAWRRFRDQELDVPYGSEPFPSLPFRLLKKYPPAGFFTARFALSMLQRRHRFDIWHGVCTWPTGVVLLDWLTKQRSISGLLRPVGDDFTTAPGVGLMHDPNIRASVERLLPTAPAIVALSRQMIDDSLALGVPAERIHEIPNAVDLTRFRTVHDQVATRVKHGLDPAKPLFLSVGRAHPQKNYPVMLDAFRSLIDSGAPAFQAAIAGRESALLKPEIEKRNLAGTVHLLEISAAPCGPDFQLPAGEMVALYQAAKVFVMPSVLEGFSSAMLEAAAAGLPLITTDGPGCRDFIRGGTDGIMVPVGDFTALADAMHLLLTDPAEAARRAAAAASRAHDFSWESTVKRYVGLYRVLARS